MKENLTLLAEKLRKKVAVDNAKTFANLTTIGCGGKVGIVAYPTNLGQLKYCLTLAKKYNTNFVVLGKGSNFLASDDDFDGLVICTERLNKLRRFATTVWCQCGVHTAKLALFCAKRGLGGCEFLYCLPATVGGAVVMNAGCFGNEMANVVKAVWYLEDNKLKKVNATNCKFSKRSSMFKNGNKVVVAVQLQLKRGNKKAILDTCKSLMAKKRATQPLGQKTFGSAFFNKDGTASLLIDKAGLKNFQIGGAKVSNLHAGFVINIDKATSFDIYLLLLHIKRQVYLKFGQTLTLEVQTLGFDRENL